MADERSVDVDERREPPPRPTDRAPIPVGRARLSPVQEAYGRYTAHATRCWACRDVDRTCLVGAELHGAWRELAEDAVDRLAGEAPSPHRQ